MRPPHRRPPARHAEPDDGRQDRREPPAFNVPPATLALAAVLVAIFALLHLLPGAGGELVGLYLSFNAALLVEALAGHGSVVHAVPQLVTHMFVHFDALHLAVNVGFLLAFASVVERRLGKLAFLALFLASGIAGALCETWLFADPAMRGLPMVGASGGIMGLMAVALLIGIARPRLDPRLAGELDSEAVALVEARMAKTAHALLIRVVIALVGLNVVIGLMSEAGLTGPYLIGWRAHLGGFALGLAVGWLVRLRQPR